jgi:hypothetical protein
MPIFLHAQIYENTAYFSDGTIINYTIQENNPLTHPSLMFNLEFEAATIPTASIIGLICFNIKYTLPNIGRVKMLIKRGGSNPDPTTNGRSDNFKESFHTEIGGNLGVVFWKKMSTKTKKLILNPTNNNVQYVVDYPRVVNMELIADIGYTRIITPVSSFFNDKESSSDWYLTDDKGQVLVPSDNRDLNHVDRLSGERQGGNFHSTMHTDLLHIGIAFQKTMHVRTLISPKKKPLKSMVQWSPYLHLLYAPKIQIDPILIESPKEVNVRNNASNYTLVTTVPVGVYDVQHDNPGGFKTESLGFRLGIESRFNLPRSILGFNFKLELGVMPGVTNYRRIEKPFDDFGRFFVGVTGGISFGCYAPRFEPKYGLE